MLCLAGGAYAQQPMKIAVINVQSAIVSTKDGQKANAKLESEYGPKKKDFDSRNAEINQLQDQLSKGGSLMSDDKRSTMVRDIDEKKRRLERDLSDARDEMSKEQQELLGGLAQRVMAVIEKYAKDNGYSLVLDDSAPSTPVLYESTAIDITQDIVALYDKTTVNGAPATAPKPGGSR
jgi:outer membrane protein